MIDQDKLVLFIYNPPDEYLKEAHSAIFHSIGDWGNILPDEQYEPLLRAELTKIYIRLVEQKQVDDHLANEWLGE